MNVQPLTGIRVIDLTRVLSGPFSTMLLADMGADVVKIETPQGDTVRGQGEVVNGLSWYFATFNRNKRSVVLDLRKDEGKALLAKLLERADVLAENFRPGVLAEMGFTEARLNEINPRLIVASINGYGSTGPYADRPSFDFIAQAMSGFMATTGEKDGAPMRAGAPITDLVAGLYCAFGVVNAIRARERTGRGQRVEAAMVNGMVSMLAYLASEYLSTGRPPQRNGNDHVVASPYGLFRTKDGDIAIAPATPEILARFMKELGLGDILDRPDMRTAEQRRAGRPELNALINERLSTNTQEHWIERLNAAGVPCGKVLSVAAPETPPCARCRADPDRPRAPSPAPLLGDPRTPREALGHAGAFAAPIAGAWRAYRRGAGGSRPLQGRDRGATRQEEHRRIGALIIESGP
jgi:crotonobetainyl-CoA:carnitine CoA-transferase CaiB-like acyl-CoA transferase